MLFMFDNWNKIKKKTFCSELTYSGFAPWVGESSRVGPVLPKTEFLKGLSKRLNNVARHPSSSSLEDVLFKELDSKKVCKTSGMSNML